MPGLTRLAVTRLVTGAFAWSSSGKTNDDLVTNLVRDRRLKLPAVEAALRRVDRKMFVLPAERGAAYDDRPLGIGYSATISAPHMHAAALEFLAPSIAEKGSVLDVGCGSGYLLAAFAALGPDVRAHGVEYVPQLAKMADENLRAHDASVCREACASCLGGSAQRANAAPRAQAAIRPVACQRAGSHG